MNSGLLRLALIAAILLGTIAVVRVAAWSLVSVRLPPVSDSVSKTAVVVAPHAIAADSVVAIASRDPFRIGHRPALPAYDPLRLAEQVAPAPPRPALVLVGVMEALNPSAVIEGLPGVEGARVVRVGDVIGRLSIKKVGGGRVVVVGMDTTWVLQVREPWKN